MDDDLDDIAVSVNYFIAEELARQFHYKFVKFSTSYGFVVKDSLRKFDPLSPNGALMIAVCAEILKEAFPGRR